MMRIMYFVGEDGAGSGSSVPADLTLEQFISDCRQEDGPFYWWLDEDGKELPTHELPLDSPDSIQDVPNERVIRVIGRAGCYGWAVESEVPDGTTYISSDGPGSDDPPAMDGYVEIESWY